jgi:histidine ammonia-lyase
MAESLELGARPLSIEDVERVARQGREVQLAAAARARIAAGRQRLEELLARGERIYVVGSRRRGGRILKVWRSST